MKVQVTIDAIGDEINSLIKDKLKKRGLPECLGDMCPPIISSIAEMEDTSLFSDKKMTPPENIVMDNILPLLSKEIKAGGGLNNVYNWTRDFVLNVDGERTLRAYKESLSDRFVNKISGCIACNFRDTCDQLTTHYLRTIYLKEIL